MSWVPLADMEQDTVEDGADAIHEPLTGCRAPDIAGPIGAYCTKLPVHPGATLSRSAAEGRRHAESPPISLRGGRLPRPWLLRVGTMPTSGGSASTSVGSKGADHC